MRVLLDECLPRKLKSIFEAKGHDCQTVHGAGIQRQNQRGPAENHFDGLVTVDQNIKHQQNMAGRKIAISILRSLSNDIGDIRPLLPEALVALNRISSGQILEVPSR